MIKRIKTYLSKREFTRNVLTLMTGTTIAQAIPVAISPILTRIYTPDDFGLFALYMGLASTISVVATGRYEIAIMLPKKNDDAFSIVVISMLISIIISTLTFLIVLVFNDKIAVFFNNPDLKKWLYFIPFSILLVGFFQSMNYWNNRKKNYKRLATNSIIKSGAIVSTNLGLGFGGFTSSGLIVGALSGQLSSVVFLGRYLLKNDRKYFSTVTIRKIKSQLLKYIDFPKINMSHAFLNVFSTNIVVILINHFFLSSIAGFYALANKVVATPMSIITGSYSQVFLQRMSNIAANKENAKALLFFKKNVKKLLTISAPFFLIFFIFSKEIFSFIFGKEWIIAGAYAQILLPMLYLRFTGSIVSSIVLIYNEQKKALIIEIISTILRISSLLVGGYTGNIILGLILFSSTSSLITIYRLNWYLKIIK